MNLKLKDGQQYSNTFVADTRWMVGTRIHWTESILPTKEINIRGVCLKTDKEI